MSHHRRCTAIPRSRIWVTSSHECLGLCHAADGEAFPKGMCTKMRRSAQLGGCDACVPRLSNASSFNIPGGHGQTEPFFGPPQEIWGETALRCDALPSSGGCATCTGTLSGESSLKIPGDHGQPEPFFRPPQEIWDGAALRCDALRSSGGCDNLHSAKVNQCVEL